MVLLLASDNVEVDFGLGFMSSEMQQTRVGGSNALGGWGVDAPGDIPEGLIEQVSTLAEFDYSGSGVAGVSQPAGETAPIALGSVSWQTDPADTANAIAGDLWSTIQPTCLSTALLIIWLKKTLCLSTVRLKWTAKLVACH